MSRFGLKSFVKIQRRIGQEVRRGICRFWRRGIYLFLLQFLCRGV